MTATIRWVESTVGTPSKLNEMLLAARESAFNAIEGARVGDFAIFPDGHAERFSHHWGDGLQTSTGGSWHIGKDFVSFSGGLNPTVKLDRLQATDELRPGTFWFFDGDWPRAHAAVHVEIDCRVYRVLPMPHPAYSRGYSDDSPSYRQDMRDAGRGGLLR